MENEPVWKTNRLGEEIAKLRETYYKTHPRVHMPRAIIEACEWSVHCPFCKQVLRASEDSTLWMVEDREEDAVRCCPRCGEASLIPALPSPFLNS